MSDEFETPHRSFKDGEDPRWTAVHKNDYTNKAFSTITKPVATTWNGTLKLPQPMKIRSSCRTR